MKQIFLPNMLEPHQLFAGSFYFEGVGFSGFRVNLMSQSSLDCDMLIPIVDYSVPQNKEFFLTDMANVIEQVLLGEPVFIGCLGGRGRTGLVLASMAHLMGEIDPLVWLQINYMFDAPETEAQKLFVMSLPCGLLKLEPQRKAWINRNKIITEVDCARSF